eukprot:scaffold21914_cov68-Phaeocystis_antarctica.AAC.1
MRRYRARGAAAALTLCAAPHLLRRGADTAAPRLSTVPQPLAQAKRVRRSMSERPALRRAQSRTLVQSERE